MRALALVLIAACSYKPTTGVQPGTDSPPGDGPNTPDDTIEPDGPPDSFVGPAPTPCVTAWLGTTTPIFPTPSFVARGSGLSVNTQGNERDPFVSEDKLTLYMSRNDDIMVATRGSAGATFNSPQDAASLTSAQGDSKLTMVEDELTVFIASDRTGGEGGADIWTATRATAGATAFGPLSQTHLGTVNDGNAQLDPHVSPDGLRLYYAIGNPQRIVVSSRPAVNADFGAPVDVAGIESTSNTADPSLSGDERVIIFTSTRAGGVGDNDLWYATRAERDQPFNTPILIPFNSQFSDADAHVTVDGCSVYFASTRATGNDDLDLFVTTMTP